MENRIRRSSSQWHDCPPYFLRRNVSQDTDHKEMHVSVRTLYPAVSHHWLVISALLTLIYHENSVSLGHHSTVKPQSIGDKTCVYVAQGVCVYVIMLVS